MPFFQKNFKPIVKNTIELSEIPLPANPQLFEYPDTFITESNECINNLKITYHTYGRYIAGKTKVVWACHALTGNSDIYEWWGGIFGKNSLFNPDEYYIVCANVIGSCYGTSGPDSLDDHGNLLLNRFPFITTRDMANAHELLREKLGVRSIHTLIGASLGGQQAMEWSIINPDIIENLILIATNARHSAFGIAFNESQRLAIYSDATFGKGTIDDAKDGLKVARSIAMLSYRSYAGYGLTQTNSGNDTLDDFLASSYQAYQGKKLADRFNAYSYITLSKAMDSHNVGRNRESIESALSKIKAKTLVVGIDSDNLFPVSEQKFLKELIPSAKFATISSDFGHDGFLVENEQLVTIISDFLFNQFKKHLPTTFKRLTN